MSRFFHILNKLKIIRIFSVLGLELFQDSTTPMTKTHFSAEGEVSFKAILFVPKAAERDMFNDYGQKRTDNIKVLT